MDKRFSRGIHLFALACTTLALAACSGGGVGSVPGFSPGGGNGNGGGSGGTPQVSVTYFSVTGTDGIASDANANAATISGSQTGGRFYLNWNTTIANDNGSGEPVRLFLSTAPDVTDTDNGQAVKIMLQGCDLNGGGSAACPHTSAGNLACRFDEANMHFLCPDNPSLIHTANYSVQQFLANHQGLPGTYYLVLQACQSSLSGPISSPTFTPHCDTQSVTAHLN